MNNALIYIGAAIALAAALYLVWRRLNISTEDLVAAALAIVGAAVVILGLRRDPERKADEPEDRPPIRADPHPNTTKETPSYEDDYTDPVRPSGSDIDDVWLDIYLERTGRAEHSEDS